VVALSGPFAEIAVRGLLARQKSCAVSSAWATDRSNAQNHLRHSLRVRTLADVETLAACMVEEQWPAIVRVAEA
jgi:hypothetical protein